MCGIIGMVRCGGITEAQKGGLERGLSRLGRRGPDGEGRHEEAGVWLGHRRLAILDPEAGAQPLRDEGTGVVLTYNGELYNFRELREELERHGAVFGTDCDTEVLLRAYLHWGRDCLCRLEGIFAFGLWDPRTGGLWLVRDRLGVKPLYYAESCDGLAFASSVAGLLELPLTGRRVDRVALAHYLLTIRSTLGSRTLVEGIRTLEPGMELWRPLAGPAEVRRYWKLPVVPAGEKAVGSVAEWAGEAAKRLDRVVGRQLVSDVPVGSFLSGGVDSSILMSSILRQQGEGFAAYSIGYDREGYHEWDSVREAGRFHGVEVEEVHLPEADFGGDWEELVWFKGLPLSTPNEVPIRRLAERFKERFTVAMTGEGADELFGGYGGPTFCAFDYDRACQGKGAIDAAALQRGYATTAFAGRLDHFFRVNSWIGPGRQRELFGGLEAEAGEAVLNWYGSRLEETACCSTLDAYLHLHIRVNLEGLLNRLDSSTMYGSVEGRVPFTDPELAAWLVQLPDSAKMALRGGLPKAGIRQRTSFELNAEGWLETKRLLRKGFAGRVPPRILQRPKMSFPVPFREWLEGDLQEWASHLLADSQLIRGLCGGQPVDRKDGMLTWPVMNLALWERQFDIRW